MNSEQLTMVTFSLQQKLKLVGEYEHVRDDDVRGLRERSLLLQEAQDTRRPTGIAAS